MMRHQRLSVLLAIGIAAGAIGLLLWLPSDPPRSTKTVEHPIALPTDADAARAEPTARELASVQELEQHRDTEGLIKLALNARAPVASPEQDLRLRVTAIHALANVGGPRAVKVLRDILLDGERTLVLRLAAASALARTGKTEELAFLRERMKDEPSRIVREKIRLSLEARRS